MAPALAADPVCNQLIAATQMLRTKPFHLYLTETSDVRSGAKVYVRRTPALGLEMKLWISKTTNLPIRTDTTNQQGPMKMLTVGRYEFSGVQAPAHAMTLKDMVHSTRGH